MSNEYKLPLLGRELHKLCAPTTNYLNWIEIMIKKLALTDDDYQITIKHSKIKVNQYATRLDKAVDHKLTESAAMKVIDLYKDKRQTELQRYLDEILNSQNRQLKQKSSKNKINKINKTNKSNTPNKVFIPDDKSFDRARTEEYSSIILPICDSIQGFPIDGVELFRVLNREYTSSGEMIHRGFPAKDQLEACLSYGEEDRDYRRVRRGTTTDASGRTRRVVCYDLSAEFAARLAWVTGPTRGAAVYEFIKSKFPQEVAKSFPPKPVLSQNPESNQQESNESNKSNQIIELILSLIFRLDDLEEKLVENLDHKLNKIVSECESRFEHLENKFDAKFTFLISTMQDLIKQRSVDHAEVMSAIKTLTIRNSISDRIDSVESIESTNSALRLQPPLVIPNAGRTVNTGNQITSGSIKQEPTSYEVIRNNIATADCLKYDEKSYYTLQHGRPCVRDLGNQQYVDIVYLNKIGRLGVYSHKDREKMIEFGKQIAKDLNLPSATAKISITAIFNENDIPYKREAFVLVPTFTYRVWEAARIQFDKQRLCQKLINRD